MQIVSENNQEMHQSHTADKRTGPPGKEKAKHDNNHMTSYIQMLSVSLRIPCQTCPGVSKLATLLGSYDFIDSKIVSLSENTTISQTVNKLMVS